MVDVFAGHLASLGPELKGIHADRAVAVYIDMAFDDLYSRHRLNGGLRCRRMFVSSDATDAADLQMRELLEKAVESGSHQKIRDAFRQGAEAGSGALVVEKLEAASGGPIHVTVTSSRRTTEHDDRIERRAVSGSATPVAAKPEIGGRTGSGSCCGGRPVAA